MFRSHGEVVKREIYNISPDNSGMRDAMVWYDKLRYLLMPYIYTFVSRHGGQPDVPGALHHAGHLIIGRF